MVVCLPLKYLEADVTNAAPPDAEKYKAAITKIIDKEGDINIPNMRLRDNREDFKMLTVCHGDPWFNNIMFKYNEKNRPDKVVFLDLQITNYGPVSHDLSYFLTASTTGPMRRENLGHLLRLYHDTLVTNINQLGSIVDYTYEDLVKEFKMSGLVGLNFAIMALPNILGAKEDVVEIEDAMKSLGDQESEESKLIYVYVRL